jgi:hypothetical protein
MILILLLLLLFVLQHWSDRAESFIDLSLTELENYPIGNSYVYSNVNDLIAAHPNIRSDDNVLIFLVNWPYGFGSALSVHAQNACYLNSVNSSLIVLPHFSQNSNHFKYHQHGYNNSFFLYFKSLIQLNRANEYKIYFAKSTVLDTRFGVEGLDTSVIPPMLKSGNARLINHFRQHYRIRDAFRDGIAKSEVGIHIRGLAQKRAHHPAYLETSIDERLKLLANHEGVRSANVFVMSDVMEYINKAKQHFGPNVCYMSDISRVATDTNDSIPKLNQVGFKLGSDILRECYAMSLSDHIYVSESNIPFIISLINPNVKMFGY